MRKILNLRIVLVIFLILGCLLRVEFIIKMLWKTYNLDSDLVLGLSYLFLCLSSICFLWLFIDCLIYLCKNSKAHTELISLISTGKEADATTINRIIGNVDDDIISFVD